MQKSEMLERTKKYVCRRCGGQLELRQTVHNEYGGATVELYCNKCGDRNNGVPKEIFAVARQYIEETDFNYYSDLAETEETAAWNVAKICDIIEYWQKNQCVLKNS